ncbi:hypothetical protein BG006_004305 [Podila minutissima]|uniref:Uncharacterized protein n=1 Tax=Podila minutissima TaxID=64525 RepID=A0A9P5SQY1_9FUNG|nr:hypothetical protein BG006_004305 [Podila minutissima]
MLQSARSHPSEQMSHLKPHKTHTGTAIDILNEIWPEYDQTGQGIMANMMETVLRRVEKEQGTLLLSTDSWEQLADYVDRVGTTVVSQRDLGDLLNLLQQTSPTQAEYNNDAQYQYHELQNDLHEQNNNNSNNNVLYNDPYPPAYQDQEQERCEEDEATQHPQQHILGSSQAPRSPPLPHPRSHPTLARPRPGIRKISLSESREFRPRRMAPQELSADDSDDNEHHVSSGEDKELEIESVQNNYLRLQKKLQDTKLEYEARSNQHMKEDMQNQQEIADLKQDLKTYRREISELKSNEQFKTSQIHEMQRDELEEDNRRMQESLRIKEEALSNATARLTTIEADSRRINADQETMEELRERLAEEITKNENMAWQLELVNNEKMRLTELTGSLKNEVENLGGLAASANLELESPTSVQGKTLMSELETANAMFGPGFDLNDIDDKNAHSPESFTKWNPAHEGTRRLLQESTSFTNKLKRSSIRDLNQRFRDSAVLEPSTVETKESQPYTQTLLLTKSSSSKDETQTVDNAIVKHRADDVDCALPPNLQAKENILSQELGTQAELIEDLIKTQDLTQQMAAGFESDIIIGPASLLGNRQQRERARRRKLQPSRVLTPAEVVDLLNPGATTSSSPSGRSSTTTKMLNRRENKNVIANVTLVSMYTIVVYLFGVITSVFLVDNGQAGFNYGRFLSFDAIQEVANAEMNGGPGRFKVVEILVYWLQNLVFQGDAGFVPT